MKAELERLNTAFNTMVGIVLNRKSPKGIWMDAINELNASLEYFSVHGIAIIEDTAYEEKETQFLNRAEIKETKNKLEVHLKKIKEFTSHKLFRVNPHVATEDILNVISIWRDVRPAMQVEIYHTKNFFIEQDNNTILFAPLSEPTGMTLFCDAHVRLILKGKYKNLSVSNCNS